MPQAFNQWVFVPGDDGLAYFYVTPNLTIGAETHCVGAGEAPGYSWYVMLHWNRKPYARLIASSEESGTNRENEPYPTLDKAMAAAENWFQKYGDDLLDRLPLMMQEGQ